MLIPQACGVGLWPAYLLFLPPTGEARSWHAVQFHPGAVEEKCIEEVDLREDSNLGHERRRCYRLTSAGRKLALSSTPAPRLGGLIMTAIAESLSH
jgi:hypothetical protein